MDQRSVETAHESRYASPRPSSTEAGVSKENAASATVQEISRTLSGLMQSRRVENASLRVIQFQGLKPDGSPILISDRFSILGNDPNHPTMQDRQRGILSEPPYRAEAMAAQAGYLFVLADGNYRRGDEVARSFTNGVMDGYYTEPGNIPVDQRLRLALQRGVENVWNHRRTDERIGRDFSGGAVFHLVAIRGNQLWTANAGDSLGFVIPNADSSAIQTAIEDSWVADRVREGLLRPEAATTHEHRNVITGGIRVTEETYSPEEVFIQSPHILGPITLVPGSMIAQFSDGVENSLEGLDAIARIARVNLGRYPVTNPPESQKPEKTRTEKRLPPVKASLKPTEPAYVKSTTEVNPSNRDRVLYDAADVYHRLSQPIGVIDIGSKNEEIPGSQWYRENRFAANGIGELRMSSNFGDTDYQIRYDGARYLIYRDRQLYSELRIPINSRSRAIVPFGANSFGVIEATGQKEFIVTVISLDPASHQIDQRGSRSIFLAAKSYHSIYR